MFGLVQCTCSINFFPLIIPLKANTTFRVLLDAIKLLVVSHDFVCICIAICIFFKKYFKLEILVAFCRLAHQGQNLPHRRLVIDRLLLTSAAQTYAQFRYYKRLVKWEIRWASSTYPWLRVLHDCVHFVTDRLGWMNSINLRNNFKRVF